MVVDCTQLQTPLHQWSIVSMQANDLVVQPVSASKTGMHRSHVCSSYTYKHTNIWHTLVVCPSLQNLVSLPKTHPR